MVRQRMLKWVAQVATTGKRVQVESLIRKHTADWYDRKGDCRCESSVCCCKLAKRWQDGMFEDLTFGDVKDDPAPKIRRTVTAFKAAKSVAVVAQRAVATSTSPKPQRGPPLRSKQKANELGVGIGLSNEQLNEGAPLERDSLSISKHTAPTLGEVSSANQMQQRQHPDAHATERPKLSKRKPTMTLPGNAAAVRPMVNEAPSNEQVMDNMPVATMGRVAIDVGHAESAMVHPE